MRLSGSAHKSQAPRVAHPEDPGQLPQPVPDGAGAVAGDTREGEGHRRPGAGWSADAMVRPEKAYGGRASWAGRPVEVPRCVRHVLRVRVVPLEATHPLRAGAALLRRLFAGARAPTAIVAAAVPSMPACVAARAVGTTIAATATKPVVGRRLLVVSRARPRHTAGPLATSSQTATAPAHVAPRTWGWSCGRPTAVTMSVRPHEKPLVIGTHARGRGPRLGPTHQTRVLAIRVQL